MNDRIDMNEWEAQINALLDGELDDAQTQALKSAAERDQALARAIIEAYELQRLIAALPEQRAPDSLREKLRQIPQQHAAPARAPQTAGLRAAPRRWSWFQPRWVMALAAVPLVVAIGIYQGGPQDGPRTPSDAELAQARQDLALAFAYLEKASLATGREIEYSIGTGMRDPVKNNTLRTIADQFELNKEQET